MKQTKVYPHELAARGFVPANWKEMTDCQKEKYLFVELYISQTVKHSDSGWSGVEYIVYTNGEEYIFFLDENYHKTRGICVTANSKKAITTAVFDNIG